MARVAAGIPQEVILVLALGFPEVAGGNDFGHGFARPQPGRIDIRDRILGNATLLVGSVENRRPIARPDVVSLAIARARIVNLEEELEDLAIADPGRIKDDLNRFRMCSVIAVGRIGRVASRVADPGGENTVVAAKEL